MRLTLTLVLVKETPRSYKFDLQKINNPSAQLLHDSTCLYINKDAFHGQPVPERLTMEVTTDDKGAILLGR